MIRRYVPSGSTRCILRGLPFTFQRCAGREIEYGPYEDRVQRGRGFGPPMFSFTATHEAIIAWAVVAIDVCKFKEGPC